MSRRQSTARKIDPGTTDSADAGPTVSHSSKPPFTDGGSAFIDINDLRDAVESLARENELEELGVTETKRKVVGAFHDHLSRGQREIINAMFPLDGSRPMSASDVAHRFHISLEDVKKLEAGALRALTGRKGMKPAPKRAPVIREVPPSIPDEIPEAEDGKDADAAARGLAELLSEGGELADDFLRSFRRRN